MVVELMPEYIPNKPSSPPGPKSIFYVLDPHSFATGRYPNYVESKDVGEPPRPASPRFRNPNNFPFLRPGDCLEWAPKRATPARFDLNEGYHTLPSRDEVHFDPTQPKAMCQYAPSPTFKKLNRGLLASEPTTMTLVRPGGRIRFDRHE